MSKQSYHSDYAKVSKTMLGHFAKSAADFERYYVAQTEQPPAPKRVMNIGSAIHTILLERTQLDDAIKVYPASCLKSDGAINWKPAKQFRDDHPDSFCMKEADADAVIMTCNAVYRHELGDVISHEEAVFELPQEFTCPTTQLPCRMMADWFVDMGSYIRCDDLKTTEDIYPSGIKRTCKTLRYWLQDAHYSAGLQSIFGKPVVFRFWFVEIKPPHRIAPYEYDPRSREIASAAYKRLMTRLKNCYASGDWRDDWTGQVNQLVINPWEVDQETIDEETELSGTYEPESL